MEFIVSFAVLIGLVLSDSTPNSVKKDSYAEIFVAWKQKYEKEYLSGVEEKYRFSIWKNNLKHVMLQNLKHDLGLSTYNLEMNKFADMTAEEFASQRLGMRLILKAEPTNDELSPTVAMNTIPDSLDWRDYGYVTDVKDQGACGSCWSFSTTGGMEGQHFNSTGTLVSLSEQQLVDCEYVDNGCHGGLTSDALTWVIKNGGSASEANYPYFSGTTGHRGACQTNVSSVATFSTFIATPRYNENYLKTAVASVGPISIAIDASGHAFQLYRRGIYNPTSCNQYLLNHGVLIAGYGSEDGTDYWLVKNSWGANWGEAGYIKMIRNENNKCGIASQAVYPLV